jgi:ABC-type Fe3+/spermidine/putrescine transport system ATPase subunit
MPTLVLEHLSKSFSGTQALADVSLSVEQGQVMALLGPSGCGKSTLLALIAGLETPDAGQVTWDGQSLAGVPPHKRQFSLMFQDFALFPHLNVSDNIAFGLRMMHMPGTEIRKRVSEVLDLVGLAGFDRRDVHNLSGGEQQRVALARALITRPRLLMLDEPLGALDRALRERLLAELDDILRDLRQTALYVTHDQAEAFAIADRLVVLNAGRVEQVNTPQEIYCCPASPFVARFLDMTNLLPAQMQGGQAQTSLGTIPVPEATFQGVATLLLRPDAARLGETGPWVLRGTIVGRSFRGVYQRVIISVNGQQLAFDFPTSLVLPDIGAPLALSLDVPEAIRVFPGAGESITPG